MSAVIDVTADVPRLADRVPARDLTPEEVASLAEELSCTGYLEHLFTKTAFEMWSDGCKIRIASGKIWLFSRFKLHTSQGSVGRFSRVRPVFSHSL